MANIKKHGGKKSPTETYEKVEEKASEKTLLSDKAKGTSVFAQIAARFDRNDLTDWSVTGSNGEKMYSMKRIIVFMLLHLALYTVTNRLSAVRNCTEVLCSLDEKLPMMPVFVIPYLSWHALLVFMGIYLFVKDMDAFRRFAKYLICTSLMTIPVFIVWPTCMPLRPDGVVVTGPLSWLVSVIYWIDRNTNVCPSLHVIWGLGLLFAAWNDRRFCAKGWRLAWSIQVFLICCSTFMIKQHSIIDVIAAVPFCVAGWLMSYRDKWKDAGCVKGECNDRCL